MLAISVVVLLGFTYGSVELTSTPGFCRTCHEIQAPHDSWLRSPHGKVKGKILATCRDCHVPSWKRPWAVIWFKLTHGLGDGYHHFAGNERHEDPEFYFGLKQKAMPDVPNATCLSCHQDILRDKDVIRTAEWGEIRGLHRSEEASKLSCTMCHKNTGHDIYD